MLLLLILRTATMIMTEGVQVRVTHLQAQELQPITVEATQEAMMPTMEGHLQAEVQVVD
jgi:hypothetical protein